MVALHPRNPAPGTPAWENESKVASIVICNGILLAISTLGILVRMYVRTRYMKVDWDDWFCLIGWAFGFVECLVCILMTQYGFGKHIDTVHDVNKIEMFLKLDFVTELTYLISFWTLKTSLSLFYLKIFPGKKFRIIVWCVIGFLLGEIISEFFVIIFQCKPVAKAWDAKQELKGSCLQLLPFFYASTAIRLATDVALLVLPIPKLLNLKMTTGKRAGLIFMFGLGGLVTIASIIRATYLNNFSEDHTWNLVEGLNWSSAELGLGVFIACVPSFKALVTFRFPTLRSMLGLSSNRSHAGPYEMYGTSGRRTNRTDDLRSWRRTQGGTSTGKLADSTVHTQTEVATSRSGSEEHIISPSREGIQVTTDVHIETGDPLHTQNSQWPLGS
ncbi:integral membrane protein [Penicillium capsulatum]|nr:integral membrane protein [Penicillium capsulatum]